MKHTPWNLDAYRFYYGENTEGHLLVNTPIREFLNNEDKFFLVGAKGLGKTLFLRYKSYQFHERYQDSIQFNAGQSELTENLNIHPDTFTKEELLQFRDKAIWQLIWELALWIMVFRIVEKPIESRLEKLIDKAHQLSTILTRLLNNRNKVDEYREFVSNFQESKGSIQSGVAIFIDDFDQTLLNFLRNPHPSDEYYAGKQSPSLEIWVNAQGGLVGAIYNINRQNAHIKIYATIRREAFEALEGEMKINYRQHASILHYEKDDIRIIFEKNIQLIERPKRFDQYNNTLIGSFLGFDELPHRFAVDMQGNKRREDAFNFIYRHTFGRPREIVLMGNRLDELVSSASYKNASPEQRVDAARILVNKESRELLQQYKQEIIPYFSEDWLNLFVEQVRSNVITKDDLQRLDTDTIRNYFNLGLIGFVRAFTHEGKMKQEFNPPATYNYRVNQPLPETDYLVIHSTMDARLLEKHTYGNFYNKYNIIGDQYDFVPYVENPIQQAAFYKPVDISGNRMKSSNESAGHEFPLEEMYDHFFQFDISPKWHEKLMLHWQSAGQILGLLGRICYCNLLEKSYGQYYVTQRQNYLNELGRHQLMRKYNAEIPDIRSEPSMERFLDKLIGRYITLGCYLVLDMRIEWIHDLLRTGKFDFTNGDSKSRDTAFSFLSRSFFIRELKKEEPRDPGNPEHRLLKQRIYSYLSKQEQEGIRSFVKDASDEINYIDWLETEEHKQWLSAHMLSKIWRPQ